MIDESLKDRLRKVVVRESQQCAGRQGSELSETRSRLKRQYLGYGFSVDDDREARGLSTYVDRTVLEAVEWAKPGLLRVFSGDEIIRFDPRTPEQEQAADDATIYVNQVIFGRDMFKIVHDVLADGLYQRVGWCLAHAPTRTETQVEKYTGLTPEEAQAVLSDPTLAITEEGAVEVAQYPGPLGMLCDLTVHRRVETRDIRIDPIPSENVIISSDARDVEHARFIAHWERRTASDLRKDGYTQELIDELPVFDHADEMPETVVGRRVNSESDETDDGREGAAREYQIYEAWLDFDINNDGIAEKVKVTYCGDDAECRIMKVEEWPLYRAPLFAACSVPMPHQAIGLCVADLVQDVQTLRTEIMRQYLDNLALSNQGELIVSEGQAGSVEYDSLLARGAGAVHRVRGDASITPLPVQTSAGESLQGLTMSDELIERRTGVSSRTQSIQADTLQNTATGAAIMEEAVNQRLELVARVYAETFFKPLGRYLLHLIHKYQDKAIQLRVKGRFMSFDPRKWDPDMDISVAVGLGTGNRARLVSSYQAILTLQQQFLTQLGPLSPVKLSNIVYTCQKLAEAAGLEAPERFFGTEEDARRADAAMASQPPQPNPQEQKVQLEREKAQAKMQLDQQKAQTDAQRQAYETQAKIALEKQTAEGKLALKAMEMRQEKELDQTRLMMGERGSGLTNIRGVGGM